MLLTYSQASVAASSGVVVLFTAALFLSGYAIQQRTLRNLREAIRPKPNPAPSPMIFLPERFRHADRFAKDTTELDDGTVVVVSDSSLARRPGRHADGGTGVPEERETGKYAQQVLSVEVVGPAVAGGPDEGRPDTEVQREGVHSIQRPPAAAAPEQDTSQEAAADAQTKQQPLGPEEKPISRAERRRRIREEIQRLASSGEPVYYQRRLW